MLYHRDYFIHYYETDLKRKALITSIMQYFEDVAILQSENLNVGLDYYEKNKIGWMLSKWRINIIKYPIFEENVKVITKPTAMKKFYANRHYEIKNADGEILVTADTLWIFVNTVLKRPQIITKEMYEKYGLTAEDTSKFSKLDEILPPDNIELTREFHVRQSDIDTNNHVNNIKYVEWALEVIPLEIYEKFELQNLKVDYKKELLYGEIIQSNVEITDYNEAKICRHAITCNEKNVCLVETEWRK